MGVTAMDWSDLRIFLALARRRSVRAAGKLLAISHSTIARRIDIFEGRLGVRLFDRQATGYTLTTAGEDLLKTAERVEEDIDGAERRLVGQDGRLRGEIKVTMPDALATHLLMPDLATFATTYPEIELEVIFSYDALDLEHREADVAIRFVPPGRSPPDNLLGRRLAGVAQSVYATPDYLRRHDLGADPPTACWIGWADHAPVSALGAREPVPEHPGARPPLQRRDPARGDQAGHGARHAALLPRRLRGVAGARAGRRAGAAVPALGAEPRGPARDRPHARLSRLHRRGDRAPEGPARGPAAALAAGCRHLDRRRPPRWPDERPGPGPAPRGRGHRRRRRRRLQRVFFRQGRRAGGAVREGPHRRRAVVAQLGLDPQAGPRPARAAGRHPGAAALGADRLRDRRGHRLAQGRRDLSRRDRRRARPLRGLAARMRATISSIRACCRPPRPTRCWGRALAASKAPCSRRAMPVPSPRAPCRRWPAPPSAPAPGSWRAARSVRSIAKPARYPPC